MTTTLLAPLCRHAPERGHRCQPYRGFDDGEGWHHDGLMVDPEFPLLYKRDPWCWSPELGFHRSRTPNVPHRLTGITGRKFVSNKGMQMLQALRLGAGWGISSEPCDDGDWTEQTWRVFEAVDYRWSGDLEPVARLGQLVGRHVDSGGQDRIADDDALLTGWFRDAILEFLPHPGLGEWNDVLLRACHGQGEGDRGWVQQQIPPEPTRRRQRRREEPRVYVWEYMTGTSHHNGGMRSISATFRMTEPTDAQAMEWMTATMRHALRWGGSLSAPA
ncbi:hypothetical protein PYK79_15320 [Streptomyces sp. ID05-04B]|uniref:hypothetical protein n=1 Tax=Streptomyces sp. ID05-04B TaxID=3028661 RepID=UPI0029C3DFB1|nr:hypothetical protein [Streptomyces sp. ID05-04B]MDX5564421.1 hypothetical protein [Streptomyces sp. ID05-04B]